MAIILEGEESKTIDKLIDLYNALSIKEKKVKEEKEEVSNKIKALCNEKADKYETAGYSFTLSSVSGRVTVSTKVAQEDKEVWGKLSDMGAINVGKSYLALKSIVNKSKNVII